MKGTLAYREKWNNTYTTSLSCVGFSLDGRHVAYGGTSELSIALASNGIVKAVVQNDEAAVVALEWLKTGIVVCGFSDGTIVDVLLEQSKLHISGTIARSHSIGFLAANAQGTYLASGSGSDIRIWQRGNRGRWTLSSRLTSPRKFQDNLKLDVIVNSFHWRSVTPGQLLVSYRHHGVQIWDIEMATVVTSVLTTSTSLGRSHLSPGQNYLAIVMQSGIDIHDIVNKLPSTSIQTSGGLEDPVLFVHNGESVLGGCEAGKVRLWKRATGTRLQTLDYPEHEQLVALAEYYNRKEHSFRIAILSSTRICVMQTVSLGIEKRNRSRVCNPVLIVFSVVSAILVAMFWKSS